MAETAEKFEVGPQIPERTVIEERGDRVRKEVSDLKADVRRLDEKIDAIRATLTEHRIETEKSFGKLRDEMRD